jgi:hypothetical protein
MHAVRAVKAIEKIRVADKFQIEKRWLIGGRFAAADQARSESKARYFSPPLSGKFLHIFLERT